MYTNIQIVLLVLYFFLKIQRFEIILLDFEIHVFLKRFKFFIDCFYLFIRIFCFLYTISNKKYFSHFRIGFYWHWISSTKQIKIIESVIEDFSFSLIAISIYPYWFYYSLPYLFHLFCVINYLCRLTSRFSWKIISTNVIFLRKDQTINKPCFAIIYHQIFFWIYPICSFDLLAYEHNNHFRKFVRNAL